MCGRWENRKRCAVCVVWRPIRTNETKLSVDQRKLLTIRHIVRPTIVIYVVFVRVKFKIPSKSTWTKTWFFLFRLKMLTRSKQSVRICIQKEKSWLSIGYTQCERGECARRLIAIGGKSMDSISLGVLGIFGIFAFFNEQKKLCIGIEFRLNLAAHGKSVRSWTQNKNKLRPIDRLWYGRATLFYVCGYFVSVYSRIALYLLISVLECTSVCVCVLLCSATS